MRMGGAFAGRYGTISKSFKKLSGMKIKISTIINNVDDHSVATNGSNQSAQKSGTNATGKGELWLIIQCQSIYCESLLVMGGAAGSSQMVAKKPKGRRKKKRRTKRTSNVSENQGIAICNTMTNALIINPSHLIQLLLSPGSLVSCPDPTLKEGKGVR